MDLSERTKCASFIEIIRVITAKYLFATQHIFVTCLLCLELSSHQTILPLSFSCYSMHMGYESIQCIIYIYYTINQKEPSQNLRSALEEKARRQQPGPTKPKRKMKPGQAKTISDLPQLSA